MNRWVEERVEAVRLALRIGGFPADEDLYRLVEWLDGCVVLRHGAVPVGMCVHREDHRGVITLPLGLTGPERDHVLAEELGHYLLTHGMAVLLRQTAPEDLRLYRLARRWEWHDEALAREFVQAWYLPSRLVQRIPDDWELAFQSRCSPEVVRRRRESLAGRVVELHEPPRWSAGRHYRVARPAGPVSAALQVVARGHEPPRFVVPVGTGGVEGTAFQLAADLVALTVPEFALKYARCRPAVAEPVEIGLADLRAWAGWGEPD